MDRKWWQMLRTIYSHSHSLDTGASSVDPVIINLSLMSLPWLRSYHTTSHVTANQFTRQLVTIKYVSQSLKFRKVQILVRVNYKNVKIQREHQHDQFQSRKRLYNHKCPFVCPSISKTPSTFISRLLSFSACFLFSGFQTCKYFSGGTLTIGLSYKIIEVSWCPRHQSCVSLFWRWYDIFHIEPHCAQSSVQQQQRTVDINTNYCQHEI